MDKNHNKKLYICIEHLIEPTLIIVGTIFIAIRNCLRVARRIFCTSKLYKMHGRVWCNKIAHSDEVEKLIVRNIAEKEEKRNE